MGFFGFLKKGLDAPKRPPGQEGAGAPPGPAAMDPPPMAPPQQDPFAAPEMAPDPSEEASPAASHEATALSEAPGPEPFEGPAWPGGEERPAEPEETVAPDLFADAGPQAAELPAFPQPSQEEGLPEEAIPEFSPEEIAAAEQAERAEELEAPELPDEGGAEELPPEADGELELPTLDEEASEPLAEGPLYVPVDRYRDVLDCVKGLRTHAQQGRTAMKGLAGSITQHIEGGQAFAAALNEVQEELLGMERIMQG